jgi:hypothetical protein
MFAFVGAQSDRVVEHAALRAHSQQRAWPLVR